MMSNSIHQPYDKLFKQAMSDPRVAKEFFQRHLPKYIQELIDFQSLQFCKETFIDQEFKLSAADVVYSAIVQDQPGYLYILVEQQTRIDHWLPLRLMSYLVRLLEHHNKQHVNDVLPIVFPLIFYNGQCTYSASTDFYELFGKQALLMKSIWSSPFQLIDVRIIADDELRNYQWSGVLEFVYKHQNESNFLIYAEEVLRWLHSIEMAGGYEYAKNLMYYIIDRTEGKDIKILIQLAQQHLSSSLERETMTFAQQLKLMGYQQGMQQGMQEAQQLFAKRLLQKNMDIISISELTGLSVTQIHLLEEVEDI